MTPAEATGRAAYRPDIDGLRAVAVVAVLAFHAFPESFTGGFVGVDIFFVISGYLISRLIWSDLSSGKFTFARFYGRRIRRIFPALAVVLAASTAVGWLLLFADEWKEFGRQLFAGVAFISNIALATEHANYFAFATHLKPLLHLWSLGVEEQFYFAWPALLFVLRHRRPRTILAVLGSVVICSFSINAAAVSRHAAMTFYLPVTRVWELALGSLVGVTDADTRLKSERLANLVSCAGLALCIGSMFLVTADHFPGFPALGPTIGTLLLTVSGRSWINRQLLASRSAVAIGLISYPLYLWHWPLLCFLRIVRNAPPPLWMMLAFLSASFGLAALTYRYVEKPIRSSPVRSPRLGLVVAVLGATLIAGALAARDQLPPRLHGPEVAQVVAASRDWNYPFGANFGRTGSFKRFTVAGQGSPAVLFIGDSHIEQYWARLDYLVHRRAAPELWFATNGGCPPLRGAGSRDNRARCDRFLDFATAEADRPEVGSVVFGAAWPAYLGAADRFTTSRSIREFGGTIGDLVRRRKRVYVILSTPMSESFSPRSMISRVDGTVSYPRPLPARLFASQYRTVNGELRTAAESAGATVIDPLSWLCPGGFCPAVTSQKILIYRDAGHLRPFYVRDHALFLDRIVSSPQTN